MKKIFTILLLACSTGTFAQSPNWLWAKSMGGINTFPSVYAGDDWGKSIAVDATGNVYTTGSVRGRADFDPGAGTYYLTASSYGAGFISKSDSSGNLVWAKLINDAVFGYSIALDAFGNIIISGLYLGAADINTDTGATDTLFLYSTNSGMFILKLDTSGKFVWGKSFNGPSPNKYLNDIAVDASGNIFTTGYFSDTVDFNPGTSAADTFFLNTLPVGRNIFISKLDSSGKFVWAKSMGGINGNGNGVGQSIGVDDAGNVYTTGYYTGTVDFNPGTAASDTFNLTSVKGPDIFVAKLNSSGNFIWAKSMGSLFSNYPLSLTVDASANILTTGYITGTVDFDPGAGVFDVTPTGSYGDIYISKLDSSGKFVWAKVMNGSVPSNSNSNGQDILTDASGNVYTTGWFYGTVDFDPGASTYNIISEGLEDAFISKLDKAGNFVWAKAIGGTGWYDRGYGVALDAANKVYLTGNFTTDTVTLGSIFLFNTDKDTMNGNSNASDIFIAKLDNKNSNTGIENTEHADGIMLYPNPASNQFTISFNKEQKNTIIKISDVLGKEIKTMNFSGKQLLIEKEKMSGGIYFISITDENKNMINRKIIIQ